MFNIKESSPLVKLFAEQGLKIRIRKDKSLGKHPSKRIFVDLPGYDYFEKKKTTYVYVGKYPRYGFKEIERNNNKNDIVFENETKKIMNHNHDDYIKDPHFQNPNTPDNMYNKYMPKQDNYYGNYDYNDREIRGPMGDVYHNMDGNKINHSMMENRNKMNMKNYVNNEDMNLNQYENNNNYRIIPSGNRNNMNDPEMNKNNMRTYYEDSKYPFYPEDKIKMNNSNQYMNDSHIQNNSRNEYNPSIKQNNYNNKPDNYTNMMPSRQPINNYSNPPIDSYMNEFNDKKVYGDRRNSFILNQKDSYKDNEPMDGPPPSMNRNEYFQRIPMHNEKNDDYERFRGVKIEDGHHLPNSIYDNKLEGNAPPYGYTDNSINNDYNRKRKYDSFEDNYMMPNNNGNYDIKQPRKSSLDNDMNRIPLRDKNNDEYMNHKTFYSAREEESKTYIRRYQYYDEKRGPNESERYESNKSYYNYSNTTKTMNEFKKDNIKLERPNINNYNNIMQSRKNSNPNIFMNNEFSYRNNENNIYNDNINLGNNGKNQNNGLEKRSEENNSINMNSYKRDYDDMNNKPLPPPYDYDSKNNMNNYHNMNYYYDNTQKFNDNKNYNSAQEMNKFELDRNINNGRNMINKYPPLSNDLKYNNNNNINKNDDNGNEYFDRDSKGNNK